MSQDLLTRIRDLAGIGAAAAVQAEFGGTHQYIPTAASSAWGCRCVPESTLRSRHVRRLCLQKLDSLRPAGATIEALLFCAVRPIYPNATLRELLRDLDYLEVSGLIAFDADGAVGITKAGIDYVEGGAE